VVVEQSVLELLETSAVELIGVLLQTSALELLEELLQTLALELLEEWVQESPVLVLHLHMSM
jgi:hypothetical protein